MPTPQSLNHDESGRKGAALLRIGQKSTFLASKTFSGFALGIVANTLWGTTFLASSITLQSWSPITASAIRFSLAVPFLYLIGLLMGKSPSIPKDRNIWLGLFSVALCAYGLLYPLQLTGLTKIPTSLSAMIMFTSPLFVLALNYIIFREKFSTTKTVALVLGALGCIILISPRVRSIDLAAVDVSFISGTVMTLTASLLLAISITITKFLSKTLDPFSVTFWSMSLGALILVTIAAIDSGFQLPHLGTSNSLLATIYLSLVCSAIAFWIWNYAIAKVGNQSLSVTMQIKTPVAAFIGVIIGHEQVSLPLIFGLAAVSLAVYISSK